MNNKVKKSTLKLFLTSGVTLTVGEDEKITDVNGVELNLYALCDLINKVLTDKATLKFNAVLKHPYKDEKGKDKNQEVKHFYNIPSDRISWFMIEEV